jgi:transcriptional regulator with XRE-family HTH domain
VRRAGRMDYRQVLATNLRRARNAKRLSQEGLALAADIDRTYLSKLETGDTWAGLKIMCKLARVLSVEPADLLARPRRRLGR